jgi:hypothetical protein
LDAPNQDCADAFSEPHDDAGRFSAGAELLELAGIVAPSIDDARFPFPGILPAHRPHLGRRQDPDGFFDDRLALPDLYTGDHAEAVAAGVRAVKMDPSTILMTMGMVTQRLGLGVTYSTTYYEPFHVARLFATMELMLKGRAAWNIVTSLSRAEAANFGRDEHRGHDARYDRPMTIIRSPG